MWVTLVACFSGEVSVALRKAIVHSKLTRRVCNTHVNHAHAEHVLCTGGRSVDMNGYQHVSACWLLIVSGASCVIAEGLCMESVQ